MVRKRSWPAVSQICSLTSLLLMERDLIIGGILEAEVNADGGQVALLELIISEPPEEGALADWAVANDDYLEEVIVLADHTDDINALLLPQQIITLSML